MSWADRARRQAGMISRDQLRTAGVTDHVVDVMLRRGEVEHQATGVFVVRGAPVTDLSRVWLAVLATDGQVGFWTAAWLWGVLDTTPATIDVIVAHERRVAIPFGVRVHRVFVPSSQVTRLDLLPITTRSWTVLDVLGRSRGDDAYRLADRALQRGWITTSDVRRRVAEYPGRTGNRMLRRLAAQCADGAAAESERRLHRLLRRARITGWAPNLPVIVDGATVAVLDVAFPRQRLAIEVDGWAYHSDVERFQRDRHRQNALQTHGWTVLRFTWWDLVNRPEYVIATVRTQLARAS